MNAVERYELTRDIAMVLRAEGRDIITPHWKQWPNNTDAALALALSDDILGVDVNVAGGEVVALVRSTTHGGTGHGDTYAVAICRAWLAWKEGQSPQK